MLLNKELKESEVLLNKESNLACEYELKESEVLLNKESNLACEYI